jgi:PilZ domain
MKNEEKRKHQRFSSLNLSYVCLDEDQRAVKHGMGRTLNLSESGILLETHFPIEAQHTVLLSIGLGDDVADVMGRLVHSRAMEEGVYEIGIEFVNPEENALQSIRQFIRLLALEG